MPKGVRHSVPQFRHDVRRLHRPRVIGARPPASPRRDVRHFTDGSFESGKILREICFLRAPVQTERARDGMMFAINWDTSWSPDSPFLTVAK
jgi:hypothetical protein